MFHAGAVLASSDLLLQLLTGPVDDFVPSALFETVEPPVREGLRAREELGAGVENLVGLFGRANAEPFAVPVPVGDNAPETFFGPIVVLTTLGCNA